MFTIDLAGKTALVTGCTKGIGFAIAKALAASGADIIGVSRSLDAGDSPVRRAVESAGVKFHAIRCDLGGLSAVRELSARLLSEYPAIGILINNAGSIHRAAAEEHADADWDRILNTNLSAPFILARELGRAMLERGSGKIVFIASLLSFQGGIRVPSYAASKGGIAQVTKALANEWAGRGVNVNAIAPGYIATDNTEALREDPLRSREILARIPAGRWGSPDDIAALAVFLSSSAAEYIHGAIIPVDGGWLAR
jgi:2-deoxy-D-gluconate 3-dehydrogenase